MVPKSLRPSLLRLRTPVLLLSLPAFFRTVTDANTHCSTHSDAAVVDAVLLTLELLLLMLLLMMMMILWSLVGCRSCCRCFNLVAHDALFRSLHRFLSHKCTHAGQIQDGGME